MEELYEKYSKLIYKYLYSLSKNQSLAEELVQETFYSAIKNSNKPLEDLNVKSWLYKIAKNKWIDYVRKQKTKYIVPFDEQVDMFLTENSIENNLIEKDDLIRFYKSIHKLDENTREVIYLRIKGELSFKEIGNVLGKTEEWARVTFYRGKFKLKEEFNNEIRK